MSKLDLYDNSGEIKGTVQLPEHIFFGKINLPLLAQAIHVYRHNQRQNTAHSKTRAEVSGGGKKPWRQKGTGRARQGSSRQPQWKGGGVAFGPRAVKTRVQHLTTKMRKAAIISALSLKTDIQGVVVLDALEFSIPKTSQIKVLFAKLPLHKTVLLLTASNDQNLRLAINNYPNAKLLFIDNINIYDLLKYQTLILTQDAIKSLVSKYPKPDKKEVKSPAVKLVNTKDKTSHLKKATPKAKL